MIQILASIALGDARLDNDHAELLHLSRALLDVPGHESLSALEALYLAIEAHFALEDEELRRLGGNNASCHLDEHALVLKSLSEVLALLRDPATSQERANHLISGLSMELLRWLPEHIREMDSGLAAQRSKSRFGGVPLVFGLRPSQSSEHHANA